MPVHLMVAGAGNHGCEEQAAGNEDQEPPGDDQQGSAAPPAKLAFGGVV